VVVVQRARACVCVCVMTWSCAKSALSRETLDGTVRGHAPAPRASVYSDADLARAGAPVRPSTLVDATARSTKEPYIDDARESLLLHAEWRRRRRRRNSGSWRRRLTCRHAAQRPSSSGRRGCSEFCCWRRLSASSCMSTCDSTSSSSVTAQLPSSLQTMIKTFTTTTTTTR